MFNAKRITATTTIQPDSSGRIGGLLITSATTATIGITDGSGNVIMGTSGSLTETAPRFLEIPAAFQLGVTVTITGTADLTVFWLPS